MRMRIAAALLAASCTVAVHADEIQFKNGDRISGTILSAEGGELVIDTAVAGKITVKLDDVATFSTDQPITLQLADDTRLNQPVATGESGNIQLKEGTVQAQPIPLASIKRINPSEKWTGAVVVGGMLERGNTRTESLSVTIDAMRRTEIDRITLDAAYRFGRQRDPDTGDDQTTTDNWFFGAKYDYFLSDQWYVYAGSRFERDRIADLDLRMTPGAGVGYQWVETARTSFYTEAGLAWLYEDYAGADSTDSLALRLAYELTHQLNDSVSLFHGVEYFPSLEDFGDYLILADAGIRADLTSSMFSELKLEVKHDSTPASGNSRTDLKYVLGVGWRF